MGQKIRFTAFTLIVGAHILAGSTGYADSAETPETLLQEAAKQSQYCEEPKTNWPRKKVSSNFDSCNDEIVTLTKAIEVSKKNPETLQTAQPKLVTAHIRKATSALEIARIYTQRDDQIPAVGFLRVACTSVDAVSPHKPTPEQLSKMKTITTDAEEMLRVFQRSCKEIAEAE